MTSANEQLTTILSELPLELQEQVLAYARSLQDLIARAEAAAQSAERPRFFICPVCFTAAEEPLMCHGHVMIPCNAERPEDCKPPMYADGHVKVRAPRWFVTAVEPKA